MQTLQKKKLTLDKLISHVTSLNYEKYENNTTSINKSTNELTTNIKYLFDPYLVNLKVNQLPIDNTNLITSFLLSVIHSYIIDNKIQSPNYDNLLEQLKEKLLKYVLQQKQYNYYSKKYKNNKLELVNQIKLLQNDKFIFNLTIDYLQINVFIADIIKDKLYVMSCPPSYNMFRPTIILQFNGIYQPISFNNIFVLKHNSDLLRKIIKVNHEHLLSFDETIEFKIEFENLAILEKPTESLTKKTTESPSEKTIDQPTKKVIEPSSEKVIDKSSKKVMDQPTEKVIEQLIEKVIDKPTDKNTNKIINKETDKIIKNEYKEVYVKLSKNLKLLEYQNLAKEHNIEITKMMDKGKSKLKTREELYNELAQIM